MKKTILMATGALVAAGFATEATAVDVDVYGQVNKSVTYADNGVESATNVADNDQSSTRIGVKGEQMLDNGLTASVLLEMELQGTVDTSGDLTAKADETNVGDAAGFQERHARVGLAGDFGMFMIGHTSTATDGIMEIDHAGVADLMSSDKASVLGETLLVANRYTVNDNATPGNTADDVTSPVTRVGGAFLDTTNFDGGRGDAVGYMTPVFNGFQGTATLTNGGDAQFAARYNGEYAGTKIAAGLGYDNGTELVGGVARDLEVIGGSITAKHESGFAGTFSYAESDLENDTATPTNMYFKAGYTTGALEVAADYTITDNDAGLETTVYGIGAQYNLGNGVSVAAAYHMAETDLATTSAAGGPGETVYTYTDVNDLDVFTANLRVKF